MSLKMRYDFGCPISRKRVYIFLIREELLADDAALDLDSFVQATAEKLHCEKESSWLLALIWYDEPNMNQLWCNYGVHVGGRFVASIMTQHCYTAHLGNSSYFLDTIQMWRRRLIGLGNCGHGTLPSPCCLVAT